jgi:hypothetical protein
MKTTHRTATERLILEREFLEKHFEGEMPVVEKVTERIIEHEPTAIERAEDELRIAEAEHHARERPAAEVMNDYAPPSEQEFYEEYDRNVNKERPAPAKRSDTEKAPPRMEGERPPESIEETMKETPKESSEIPKETQSEETKESINEVVSEIEIPETDIELPSESDTEISPDIEWDIEAEMDNGPDYDIDYQM